MTFLKGMEKNRDCCSTKKNSFRITSNSSKTVYKHAPNTRIVLLDSPMVSGNGNVILVNCLKKVVQAFENDMAHKPITLFEFQPMIPKGCGYHPNIADDKIMKFPNRQF